MNIILIPAYGRDYKTATAVRADYAADRDFLLVNDGRGLTPRDLPINRPQVEELFPTAFVCIRYDRSFKNLVINPKATR